MAGIFSDLYQELNKLIMKLGFVSAILPELSIEEVFEVARSIGYDCVEIMCWPIGKKERKFAGVSHIDITELNTNSVVQINNLQANTGVTISGLGYYPNPLTPDTEEAKKVNRHIYKMIDAAAELKIFRANSFIGRDWSKTIEANWTNFLKIWKPIVDYASSKNVYIGIENCPMFFTNDEWPGGKNLAVSPAVWRRMFEDIPSKYFGLNFDPSHLILQGISISKVIKEFGPDRFFHAHAKDMQIDKNRLDEVGYFANPSEWHTPKLPGKGAVDWRQFFIDLKDTGYNGAVCVEVEDPAYEGPLDKRIESLKISFDYLKPLIV